MLNYESGSPRFEFEVLDSKSQYPKSRWREIAEDLLNNYYKYEGFVIICGTDTMAYCASAISFMLEHLAKTVPNP